MFEFTRRLTRLSACAYATWRLSGAKAPIVLKTRAGVRFELRPNGCGNNDYGVAYEVFVHGYYDDADGGDARHVRLVVDLGANVGYSLLHFLHAYPECRIVAFEPHPGHAAQAMRNLQIDGTEHRVELNVNAAGASTRALRLTDKASSSSLTDSEEATIAIEVVDIFPALEGLRIDVLKMDIEGGEYEILADPRFARLDIGRIVMEWHSRGGGLADKHWCQDRLGSLGYEMEDLFTEPSHGMFTARPEGARYSALPVRCPSPK